MHCGTPGRTPPRRSAFAGRLILLVLPLLLALTVWAAPASAYPCASDAKRARRRARGQGRCQAVRAGSAGRQSAGTRTRSRSCSSSGSSWRCCSFRSPFGGAKTCLPSSLRFVSFGHVLVVGAGQMGAGIAQVVAASGRRVSLHDAVPGAVEHGLETMRRSLGKLAEKGGADPDEVLAGSSRSTSSSRPT